MRKFTCLIIFFFACLQAGFAQNTTAFYGVDFSLAQTYGCRERASDFAVAFAGINSLFVEQPEKYDVDRDLHRSFNVVDVSVGERSFGEKWGEEILRNPHAISCLTRDYSCRDQIDEVVKNYSLRETEGEGVIFFGNLLDKTRAEGSFFVVVFDIATRKVRECDLVWGKAGGFGLRNYWANALHRCMVQYRRMK